MIKDKNRIWISQGIKIGSYLKIPDVQDLNDLKFVYNAYLLDVVNEHALDSLRLEAISQIDLTP